MVRIIIASLLMGSLLFGDALTSQIREMIGSRSYQSNQKLIRILFHDHSRYLTPYGVDIRKVAAKLKANGLLKLQLPHTRLLTLSFATPQDDEPALFTKLVKNVMSDIGYNNLFTKKAMRDRSGFLWSVTLESDTLIDPEILAAEFAKRGAKLEEIRHFSANGWRYNIDISRAHLLTRKVIYNRKNSYRKPLSPYWFDVENARTVVINSHKGNSWHPYIVFYDRALNMIDNVSQEKRGYNIKLNVPERAKYIKIDDIYTLENLRRGISIYISKR